MGGCGVVLVFLVLFLILSEEQNLKEDILRKQNCKCITEAHNKTLSKAITASSIGKYCPLVNHNCIF